MPRFQSKISPSSATFAASAERMTAGLAEVRNAERVVAETAKRLGQRYAEQGMLLPRERLDLLLDRGAPFLELSSLAGYRLAEDPDGTMAGGGMIAGIGFVAGVRCLVSVDNFVIKGGTLTEQGMYKKLRYQEIALEQKLPYITLAQSGGANLRYITDFFVEGGKFFANRARLSAAGIPQITVVHGSATAGGAYDPGLSDYVVLVRGKATMYLAGPPLLKAATGEIATEEELGGAEMHATVAGNGEYLAESDAHAIAIARELMGKLCLGVSAPQLAAWEEPAYSPDELIGVVPTDPRQPFDILEVVARIADGSDILEFKNAYDDATVCGHITVEGMPIGFVGNNRPITAKGAAKAAQFVQLCDQAGIPLLFLNNTTGFMVGTEQERNGIIKHGAKLIQAITNARVPRFTIMIGGSYGAGNYAMCGRGMDPEFLFSWPHSRVAVMGPAQAGMVLRIVGEAKYVRQNIPVPEDVRARVDAEASKAEELLEHKSQALHSTAKLWDDGIIDPRDTRKVLAMLLQMAREAKVRTLNPNSFGVARL